MQAGDNIWVNADVLMTHDVCGPGTIGVFKREFGKTAKVWDKNKIVIIPDHYIFTADSKSNRNVDILRDFVKEQDIPYFYDVIDDPNGHWHFDASKGMLNKQYGSRYAGASLPPPALPQKRPLHASGRNFFSARIRTLAWRARSIYLQLELEIPTRAS